MPPLLRTLRATDDTLAPRPGFYARVMERIEAQRPIDIWQLFFDSAFGRRIAMASVAMVVLFGFYLVSSERFAQPSRLPSRKPARHDASPPACPIRTPFSSISSLIGSSKACLQV